MEDELKKVFVNWVNCLRGFSDTTTVGSEKGRVTQTYHRVDRLSKG